MQEIVLVIHLLIAIALVVVVLLQRSEGGALGIGGGGGAGGAGMFSARGTANALTRATAILATMFMCTSLLLAILAGERSESRSVIDSPPVQTVPAPAPTPQPEEPRVPLSQ